ncbi:STAS domain-containing protein [Streptomyces sp. NPDC047141]|uniref:STAS domain-containing protein n=1 Tax=Streptomyces sp. NPDC047141 TaxID=3155738 RepID=UPI0033FE8815
MEVHHVRGDEHGESQVLFTHVPSGQIYSAPGGAGVFRQTTGPDGTARLQATGELDTDTVTCLHQAMADALGESATCMRIDLTTLAFGDVALVETLLHAQAGPARLVLAGPPVRLHAPPPRPHRPVPRRNLRRTRSGGSPGGR